MKTKLLFSLVIAALCGATSSTPADEVDLARVLGHGQTCDHVMDLVLRHGVNNSVSINQNSIIHHGGFGGIQIPASEIGDLELSQITALATESGCGPKFAIVVCNKSTREVCEVRVSAVALLGRICSQSPTTIGKVQRIGPGEATEIHLTMPVECLSMGNHNGQVVGFRRLLVAIDSFDQFVESNEANNIQVFDLSSIPIAVETVVQPDVDGSVAAPTAGQANVVINNDAAANAAAAAAPLATAAPTAAAPVNAAPVNADPATVEQVTDDVRSAINRLNAQQPTAAAPTIAEPAIPAPTIVDSGDEEQAASMTL